MSAVAGLFVALLSAAATGPGDPLRDPVIERWPGLGLVYALAQDAHGYLWIGTGNGLVRFDGLAQSSTEVPVEALGDRHARVVHADRDGLLVATGGAFLEIEEKTERLLLGSKKGRPGLVRVRGREVGRVDTDALASPWIVAIAAAGDIVWLGTEAGLAQLTPAGARPFPASLPAPLVTALAHDVRSGTLWVGTAGGLVALRDGNVHATEVRDPVLALAIDRDGRLLAATPHALIAVAGTSVRRHPVDRAVTALAVDGDGVVWAGAEQGVARVELAAGATLRPLAYDGRVLSAFVDREGSAWLGTRASGLAQLRRADVRNLGAAEGVDDVVFAIHRARDASLWMTTTGAVVRWAGGTATRHAYGGPVPSWALRGIAEAPDGTLWFTDGRRGLVRRRAGAFAQLGPADGVVGREARTVAIDPRGGLWVGWGREGVTHYPAGEVSRSSTTIGPAEGVCDGPVTSILFRRGGGAWLGGPAGLTRLDGARGRCQGAADGLPADDVGALHEDPDGTLWIGTAAGGVVRLRAGTFRHVPVEPSLHTGTLFALVDDGAGHFWATSAVGVLRFARADAEAVADGRAGAVRAALYDARAGLRSQECIAGFRPAAALDGEGRLWVPTLGGVSVITPPARAPAPRVQLRLERATSGGQPVDPRAGVLPRGGGDLELVWTAPTFLAPDRLRFQHRMVGVDPGWIDDGQRRSVRHPQLGPGRYRFELRAIDAAGRPVGETLSLALTVPPRLHQSPAFYAAVAVALLLLAIGAHRLRLRQVEARHRALEAERARIARELHDGLAQGFAAVGLQLDTMRLSWGDAPAAMQRMLEGTREMIERCRAEAKRAIWNIRGDATDGAELKTVLERAVAAVPRPRSLPVAVTVDGAPPRLRGQLAHEVRQIAQEAVMNAVRHASPRRIDVQALFDEDGLHLAVCDDGRGLAGSAGGGAGLIGMRERAAQIGATLSLHDGADGGTRVHLHVPPAAFSAEAR